MTDPRRRPISKFNRYSALPLLVPVILLALLADLGVIGWSVVVAVAIAMLVLTVVGRIASWRADREGAAGSGR